VPGPRHAGSGQAGASERNGEARTRHGARDGVGEEMTLTKSIDIGGFVSDGEDLGREQKCCGQAALASFALCLTLLITTYLTLAAISVKIQTWNSRGTAQTP
jgi:hypothetical protein